jgi:hypothetical protein
MKRSAWWWLVILGWCGLSAGSLVAGDDSSSAQCPDQRPAVSLQKPSGQPCSAASLGRPTAGGGEDRPPLIPPAWSGSAPVPLRLPNNGLTPVAFVTETETEPAIKLPPRPPPRPAPVTVSVPAGSPAVIASAGLPPVVAVSGTDAEPSDFAADRGAASGVLRAEGRFPQTGQMLPPPTPTDPEGGGPVRLPAQFPGEGDWHSSPMLTDPDWAYTDPLRCSFYARAEYLLWWMRGYNTPPLVTTSSPADNGILGQPTTQVLFGNDLISHGAQSGGRFRFGWCLDCDEALETEGFFLTRGNTRFTAGPSDTAVIARPFFSVNLNSELSQLVNSPGIVSGRIVIDSPGTLWGIEPTWRCNLCCGATPCGDRSYRFDVLAGFRYLDLNERLTIEEDLLPLSGAPASLQNTQALVIDNFRTRNQFYGIQIGCDAEYRWKNLSFDMRGKLAIGDDHQSLDISGSQTITSTTTGQVQNFTGGLLALDNNIGHFTHDQFSFVPEIDLNVGYFLTDHLRVFAGYTFLFWTNVIRPGDQIDRNLDQNHIPNFATTTSVNGTFPGVPFHMSSFWAQGINVGLEYRY